VTNDPLKIADEPSVSVISDAIWPDVALSMAVIIRFRSMRSLVSL
jgi:hypothetical protein